MNTITYDRQADEQKQMRNRFEHARTHINEEFEPNWDEDGLGVRVSAASVSILRQVHWAGFSTFEWTGVEQDGQRFRTHFRLR